MKFTTYKNAKPIGKHECPDWEIEFVANGEQFIEGWIGENQYILDGEFVDMPPQPSIDHVWSWDELTWIIDVEFISRKARHIRDLDLQASDWTQLPDVPESTRLKWQAYRQALRDITLQDGFPQNIIWPEMPE